MKNKQYIEMIKNYCIAEDKKKIDDIKGEYQERLDNYIYYSLYMPSRANCSTIEIDGLWIEPYKIILSNGFEFYHHSPKEIFEYSIKKRGDYEFLISQMNSEPHTNILDLKEYPSPFTQDKLYMVRLNGNHRTGVFRTIGLPFVTARIEKLNSNKWTYLVGGNIWFVEKFLNLLVKIKLIENYERRNSKKYIIIPKTGLAIWILPGNYCISIVKILKDIRKRIRLIENLYPDYKNKIPKKLRSKLLLLYILISK